MGLTISPGPLAGHPPETVNYRIDGPKHRLLMHDFPRRIRAEFGGRTVLDSDRAKLLHETGLLPVLYIPFEDVDTELLEQTAHHTHCPFKGEASYWTVRAGGRVAENAVWSYPRPKDEAPWLTGYAAFYWDRMDAWYDEDERVEGHIRDPYHRVDVRDSSRPVRVLLGDMVIAESKQPRLLSETGLANRMYLPPESVRRDLLEPSKTVTVCPYKGTTTYWNLRVGDRLIEDVAWSYDNPVEDATKITGLLSFDHKDLKVEVAPPTS